MKILRIAFLFFLVILTAGAANANTLTFSQVQLDAFTVIDANPSPYFINDSFQLDPANAVTVNPLYSDGLTQMSGVAGATGYWPSSSVGDSVDVYLGSEFSPIDLGGFTTLAVRAFNDNDDIWGHDVWIETQSDGRVVSSIVEINGSTAGAPNSALLTLDISNLDLSNVVAWGVSVHGELDGDDYPSGGDAFHSSWAPVPEPGTLVMLGLGMIGLAGVARKKFIK